MNWEEIWAKVSSGLSGEQYPDEFKKWAEANYDISGMAPDNLTGSSGLAMELRKQYAGQGGQSTTAKEQKPAGGPKLFFDANTNLFWWNNPTRSADGTMVEKWQSTPAATMIDQLSAQMDADLLAKRETLVANGMSATEATASVTKEKQAWAKEMEDSFPSEAQRDRELEAGKTGLDYAAQEYAGTRPAGWNQELLSLMGNTANMRPNDYSRLAGIAATRPAPDYATAASKFTAQLLQGQSPTAAQLLGQVATAQAPFIAPPAQASSLPAPTSGPTGYPAYTGGFKNLYPGLPGLVVPAGPFSGPPPQPTAAQRWPAR